jgi:hypothetical protein
VLEPDEGKLSSPVLRGLSGRKAARLPGDAPHSKNAGRFGTSCGARPIQLFEAREATDHCAAIIPALSALSGRDPA